MTRETIGLLYLGLHCQLVKLFGLNNLVTRKELFTKLGRHYMIPKDLRHYVVDEMIKKNLLERINRNQIKILETNGKITKKQREMYGTLIP